MLNVRSKLGFDPVAGMSRRVQRTFINVVFVVLALLPFLAVSIYFNWPWWGVSLSLLIYAVSAFSLVNAYIPKKPLPYSYFIEGLSAATLPTLIPVGAMAALFWVLNFFKVSGLMLNGSVALLGIVLFYMLSIPSVPQAVKELNNIVRGRAQPSQINGKDIDLGLDASDPGILWGGVKIPSSSATRHFMVVGTTGSGKTLTLRLLMQQVLQTIGSGANHRALIYDAKQDIVSVLAGMGLHRKQGTIEKDPTKIYTLNPFDERCVAWDMAADVNEPAVAFQTATLLAPSDRNASQPFFTDATQLLLYGVILAFLTKGSAWTFGDIIRTMQSADAIKEVLDSTAETKPIAERFYGNKEVLQNIMATVATKMIIYEPIAAMWEKAYQQGRKISLTTWLSDQKENNSILILGNNEKARKPLDAINRVLFQRITELILDQSEDREDKRRTWIFLDEVAEAGELDGLMSLLAKGRSKGACVVLGFQDIEALRDVYGEQIAHALTGQCNNKAILRLESPATAEWASKLFGSYEAIEQRYSYGGGPGGGNWSYAEEYANRQSLLESQFYILPVTNRRNGLSGYYIVPEVGAYYHNYRGDQLFGANKTDPNKQLMAPAEDVSDMEMRPGDEQRLTQWGVLDLIRLKIPQLARAVKSVASTQTEHMKPPAEKKIKPRASAARQTAPTQTEQIRPRTQQ